WYVGRNQEQGHVVGGSQVGQLGGPVTMLYVRVGLVQSPGSPGGTFNVLVEFREHYFQFSMVKIPCDHMHCFQVFILLFATERVVEVAKGRASVSIRWYVYSSYQDNGKLTGKVNRPASDFDELQVSGAVPIDGGHVCAPAVVHVHTQSSSPGLTGVVAPVMPVCCVAC
ncbi:hypothetical protein XENOCAPTIV_016267, partial [Xenoophorus captivus]